MDIGLVGRKCGMTRIFLPEGQSIPVTVIEVQPNYIIQVKSVDTDGYAAIQVTKGSKKANRVNKAIAGHFAKANVQAGEGLWEFRIAKGEYKVGDSLSVSLFNDITHVDVGGISKGKGFAGAVKRHNFATQDATHGNSLSHRAPGSIGQNQSPGRVFKGKKMAGHMGNVKKTIQSLELIKVDVERNLLLVKGAVPGAIGGTVFVKAAVKRKNKHKEATN